MGLSSSYSGWNSLSLTPFLRTLIGDNSRSEFSLFKSYKIFCFKPELLSYLSGDRNSLDFLFGCFLFKIFDFLSIILFIIINNNYTK